MRLPLAATLLNEKANKKDILRRQVADEPEAKTSFKNKNKRFFGARFFKKYKFLQG